mgnify:CR=1 FL=1
MRSIEWKVLFDALKRGGILRIDEERDIRFIQKVILGSSERNSIKIQHKFSTECSNDLNWFAKFSLGLAVPAQVPNRSIFTNLGTVNNIPLPSKISQFYSPVRTKRMIQKFTHQDFFNVLENIFDSW